MGNFKHSGFAHPLEDSMTGEAFLKTKEDVLIHLSRDHENSIALFDEAYEQLKSDYPNLNMGSIKHSRPSKLYDSVFNVTTSGNVEDIICSAKSVFFVENNKVEVNFGFTYSLDGNESVVWVSNCGYSYLFYNNLNMVSHIKKSKSIADVSEFKSKILEVFYSVKSISKIIRPELYDNSLTLEQVMNWITKQETGLDWNVNENSISGSTRDNAFDFVYPAKADIDKCKRVEKMIHDKFANAVVVRLDTVDEWATVNITLK